MKTHWKIYLLILGLCGPLLLPAQVSRVEQQPGYWTFGLNGGLSYQSSDIPLTLQGFGLGATLGKNIYYQPGAPFSFDLRGRFLYAAQYGLDGERSFDISKNEALNGEFDLDYTNYPAGLGVDRGFVYQNHRTDVAELALEGVLTFNRLRENTGVIASIFGGVGLDWYRTKIDQADASGAEYFDEYAALDENGRKSQRRNELRNAILDGNYETLADDFEEAGKLKFMPSLGLEIGYELTPNFSIFAGHRLTFAGNDLLDGHQWKEGNNDLYHYTNFGLRWKIHGRSRQEVVVSAPEIDVTRPYTDPYRTRDAREGFVRADIRHINSDADVECRLDGREIPFRYSYGAFETEFPLQPGRNEIRITARNRAGSVSKTVVIFLEETETPPVGNAGPTIVLTDPPFADYQVQTSDFTVRAVIGEVRTRNGVQFYLNGQAYGFDYNITNGNFSANVPLREGRNEVRIVARNESGQTEEATTLIREAAPLPAPRVQIVQPSAEYTETREAVGFIAAATDGIDRKDQIRFLINGQPTTNFVFDTGTGRIEASIPLQQGNNTIEIIGNNEGGSDADRVSIVLRATQPPAPRPVVDIQTPGQSRVSTFDAAGDLVARVQYVNSRSDITVEVNGRAISNFTYNNGQVRANVLLREGENEVRVTAYNQQGNASDVVYILREREVIQTNPPRVSILTPRDRENSYRPEVSLRASTQNVLRKNDVAVLVNNRRFYDFSFNTFSGEVRANVPLEPGLNQIRIQVRNPDGQDETGVSVDYRPPLPPTVRIISPANGERSQQADVRVQAIAQHVDRINQLGFYVNGQRLTRFDFSGARGEIAANVRLQPGQNTIRITAANADGRAEDQVEVFFEQLPAPIVRINRPADNSRTEEAQVRLEATVQHVRGQNDIELTVNGSRTGNFGYNASTNSLTADINLQTGQNTIQVRAVNRVGSDAASVRITYAPLTAPTVEITNPSSATAESTEAAYTLRARTTQVKQRGDITLTVNGQRNDQFTWDAQTGVISLPLTLQDGENRIRIQVRNAAGQAEAGAAITYQAPQPPTVTIQAPENNFRTAEDKITVRAKVTNTTGKRNIIFKFNGRYRTDFSLLGENLMLELNGLREGPNQISINVSNPHGRDYAEVTVFYEPVRVAAPVVKILSISNPVIDFNNPQYGVSTMTARIENIEKAEQVKLTVNGQAITEFRFNPAQQNFEATLLLKRGQNNIVAVEAQNEVGKSQDSREVKL